MWQRRDFDLDVDSIQQRAGNLAPITRHLIGRAAAFIQIVPKIAAGTRIHRRNQLELGRKVCLARGTRDGDAPRLQRFAQHLQHAAVKFGQFIKEQYTMVRERNFAGFGITAAAHQRHAARGMVG